MPVHAPAADASEAPVTAPVASPLGRSPGFYATSRRLAFEGLMLLAAVGVPYVLIYPPWNNQWKVPLAYHQDVNFHAMLVKTMMLGGGYKTTPSLGAPFGQQLHDFPLGGDHLHLLVLKLLTFFSHDPYIVLNIYYALSFFLVALLAYAVFRTLGLHPVAAAPPAVLFAFLPYHFWHHTSRIFLSAYYAVPLGALLAVWVATNGVPLGSSSDEPSSPAGPSKRIRWMAIAACVLVVGSGSAYYAVFSLCIIGSMGIAESLRRLSVRPLAGAAVVVGGISLVLVANLAPDLLWRIEHGVNTEVAQRTVAETEHYGLRLTQMILPSDRERLSRILTFGPAARATVPGEDDAYIGVVGVAGLVLALGVALAGSIGDSKFRIRPPIGALAVLPLIAILFGEVGGLSVLIATLGFTAIRSWSRIGLFVSFAALGVLAAALQQMVDGLGRRTRQVLIVIAVFATSLALIDLVPEGVKPAYGQIAAAQSSDKAFVHSLESELQGGAMVFQLPVVPFPEGPHIHDLIDYDLLKGYISGTGKLRWSYGGMRGRESDWQLGWALQPTPTMVQGLAAAGFSALYVDRAGYGDRGAAIDALLRPLVGAPSSDSRDGRLRWYDLRPLREELSRRLSGVDVDSLAKAVTRTPFPELLEGFSAAEIDPAGNEFRWISDPAKITLRRAGASATVVTIAFTAHGAQGTTITVRSGTASTTATLSPEGTQVELSLVLDRPTAVVHLTAGTDSVGSPGANPELRVQLVNVNVVDPVVTRVLQPRA